jgi:hypothetical protein
MLCRTGCRFRPAAVAAVAAEWSSLTITTALEVALGWWGSSLMLEVFKLYRSRQIYREGPPPTNQATVAVMWHQVISRSRCVFYEKADRWCQVTKTLFRDETGYKLVTTHDTRIRSQKEHFRCMY